MGWLIDTLSLTISLITLRMQKVQAAQAEIPRTQCRTSRQKWARLVGILRSIAPDLPGGGGIFFHLQAIFLDNQGRLL